MAYNFPDSPSNGDTFTLNGVTYAYNSTKGVWKDTAVGTPPPPSVTSSDTAPANPSAGDLWYRTDVSSLYVYYNDGSSSQWVGVSGPAGPAGPAGANGADGADGADGSSVISYANFAAFPTTNNTTGDFGFAQDTKALYMWDGTEWDRVALGNDESPVITTEPPTTQELNSDGTTSTVTMVAQDPEGFDITYGIAYKTANNARPSQLSADTTINQSTGVYTFTPTTTEANAGSFRARLSASDGARITTRFVDFNLTFIIADITNWQHHSLAPMEKITDGKALTNNGSSWQSYVSNLSTLAPYLEGAWGTTDVNSGMGDAGSVTFDGPVRIWLIRDSAWNGVSDINTYTSHATLSSTAIAGSNVVNVYRKDVSAGTYNLDTFSAMYFITAQDGTKDKIQYYGTDLP